MALGKAQRREEADGESGGDERLGHRDAGVEIRGLPETPVARSVWVVRLAHRRTPAAAPMIAALRSASADLRLLS